MRTTGTSYKAQWSLVPKCYTPYVAVPFPSKGSLNTSVTRMTKHNNLIISHWIHFRIYNNNYIRVFFFTAYKPRDDKYDNSRGQIILNGPPFCTSNFLLGTADWKKTPVAAVGTYNIFDRKQKCGYSV